MVTTKEINRVTDDQLMYLPVIAMAVTGWVPVEEGDLPLLKELEEMNLVEINSDNTEYRFTRRKQSVPSQN